MSGPYGNDWFGGRGRGASGGMSGSMWEAMERLGEMFESRGGPRTARGGDVRAAILALLAEAPMHGYQILSEIELRSGGLWKPSPGSVYPTLQLLVDEGLARAEEEGGRKKYSLTEEGRLVANAASAGPAPWESAAGPDGARSALPKAGFDLAQAVAQVGRSGNPAQVNEAVAILNEARRKIFSILARD